MSDHDDAGTTSEGTRQEQLDRIRGGQGFFAALDQSGGSTPKALKEYGVTEDRWSSDAEMFDLVHAERTRIVTDPAFGGDRVLAAILFEQTMEREVEGVPTARYLWEIKRVVPILKVDQGLADAADGVQRMKPIDGLDGLLDRARAHGIVGTKMRSVIAEADPAGVAAVVDQQLDLGRRIIEAGLVPILEPEVSIDSPSKDEAEQLLDQELRQAIATLPDDALVMLKLTIPSQVDRYADLAADPHVLQVLALSGGYSRDEACDLLRQDHTMIASFSRALLEGLTEQQSDEDFTRTLDASIGQIYAASVEKAAP